MTSAFNVVWSNKALWAIHLAVNAALAAAVYGWLWIPDSTITDLVLSLLAGLAILLAVSWFHSGTLEYFRTAHAAAGIGVWSSFRVSWQRVGTFALWLALLFTMVLLVLQLQERADSLANWTASTLTFRLRRPISPVTVARIFSGVLSFLAFVAIPFLLLQLWRWKPSLRYFLTFAIIVAIGAYLPYKLVWWIPEVNSLYGQVASMGSRFLVAYVLAVTAWLVLASTLGQIRKSAATEVSG